MRIESLPSEIVNRSLCHVRAALLTSLPKLGTPRSLWFEASFSSASELTSDCAKKSKTKPPAATLPRARGTGTFSVTIPAHFPDCGHVFFGRHLVIRWQFFRFSLLGGDGRFNHPQQLAPALLRRRGTGEDLRQLHAPTRDAVCERRDVRLHRFGRHPVGLGEDEHKRDGVAREPFHEFQVNLLRWQPGVEQREDTDEIRAMFQIIGHRLVELGLILPRHLGEPVTWQIHQSPALVHREDVDELGEAWRGRDPGQTQRARKHVQQRRLADVGAADKSKFRQRLVGTRIQVRRAAVKNGG